MDNGLIEFGESRKAEKAISKVFSYNGGNVTFARKGELVMVNATQMAKQFNKQPKDWTRLKSSKTFMEALMTARQISLPSDLVRVTNGDKGATWMHEDVAIEFARWLSPDFAIWCNDRIKELLTTGTVTLQKYKLPKTYSEALRELADKVDENNKLQLENKRQADVIAEQKPKVVFADAITGSKTNILIRDLAKLIQQNGCNIGEKRLFQWMRENGYLCTYGKNYNKPMQRYVEQGLFFLKEGTHSENGVVKSNFTTMVTGKGQQYFVNKFVCREMSLFTNMEVQA